MTPPDPAAPGIHLLRTWRRLSPLPGGRWLFTRLVFRTVPYSATTGATVLSLAPGRARVRLRDRRRVRNHLRSIHAIALANVGELAAGLAMLTALPPDVRGIVTRLEIDFVKKARGTVTGDASVAPLDVDGPRDHLVRAELTDEEGDTVARTAVTWHLERR